MVRPAALQINTGSRVRVKSKKYAVLAVVSRNAQTEPFNSATEQIHGIARRPQALHTRTQEILASLFPLSYTHYTSMQTCLNISYGISGSTLDRLCYFLDGC